MRYRLALVSALVLLAAPSAAAKAPPNGVRLCGASGACATIGREDAERLSGLWSSEGLFASPAAPAPFYTLRYEWPGQPEQTTYWIPSRSRLRGVYAIGAAWSRFDGAQLEQFAAGIAPLAAPEVTSASVGGKAVQTPKTYLRLLRAGRVVLATPDVRWIRIRLASTEPSPWTDAAADLRISARGQWLLRDDFVFKIPRRLAEQARRGVALVG